MTGTSPNRVGPPNRDAGPPGIPSAACDEEQVAVVPAWLTLPPEIWERILTNIALQALYRAPYLSTLAKVNQFVENMCQNDRGALVPETSPSTAIVEEAISAGLSPRSKLQCMRFSETPAETLDEFREFIAFRARPMQPMYFDYVNEAQHALYDLAINSGNLPNLRLLIVEADSVHLVQPLKLLK
ncbi:hypothetical protein [Sporisorium scitamineum]|uniref:F-box domain-containing protein n=1 Tax=Sporisorium scitamineum TaxID=49012 RepID=A0A0F7SCL1_9BASI|nr:hypothetical protein [Sporisorium scitamineum]